MAGLSDGYIYFIEAEAAQQNWLHDPDTIVIGNFTEGTHYCKLEIPQKWIKAWSTGMVITPSGGGRSFQLRPNRRFFAIMSQGIKTSIANGDLVEGFFTIDRHTAASASTYKNYYLIIRRGSSDYVKFTDHDSNRREYCKGAVTDGDMTWNENDPQNVIIRVNFQSIWGGS